MHKIATMLHRVTDPLGMGPSHFPTMSNLQNHFYNAVKNCRCQVCDEAFALQSFLNADMKSHFEICKISDKTFKIFQELEAHEKLDFN